MAQICCIRSKDLQLLNSEDKKNKKAKDTKSGSWKENLNLKIIKTVQKQFNLRIKYPIQKNKIVIVLKKIRKNSQKSNKLTLKKEKI